MSVFFEHQGLTYELPDGTTPDIAIQKIKQHLGSSDKTESLANQIPNNGVDASYKAPEYTGPESVLSNIGKSFVGGLETIGSVGTQLTSGMAGGILGFHNNLLSGRDPVKGMQEGAQALSYEPKTDIGQQGTEAIMDPLHYLIEPMMGHMTGFNVPLPNPKKSGIIPPVREPIIETPNNVSTDVQIRKTLQQNTVKQLSKKIDKLKEQENEIDQYLINGTATPELQEQAESLYQQRIRAEHQLDSLQEHLGIKTNKDNKVISNKEDVISEIQKIEFNIKRLKEKAKTQQLSDDEINLFDILNNKLNENKKQLGSIIESEGPLKHDDSIKKTSPVEMALIKIGKVGKDKQKALSYKQNAIDKLDLLIQEQHDNSIPGKDYSSIRRSLIEEIKVYTDISEGREPNLDWFNNKKKTPLEPTETPLEASPREEGIPTPTEPKTNVLEVFKKNQENEHPPGNVNWDRSLEWTSDSIPDKNSWRIQEELLKAEFERLVNENIKAEKEAQKERDFYANQPPPNKNYFSTRQDLYDWLDQQRDKTIAQIQRVQDLLNWAKKNNQTEVQLKNKKVTLEDLHAARDNLNRRLEDINAKKTKSLYTVDELNPDLPKISRTVEGALYTRESILRRLDGVINKYESILKRLRDNIKAYDDGQAPAGGSVFTFKEKEYGIEAAKGLEELLTDSYTRYLNNRDKILKQTKEGVKTPKDLELPKIDESLIPEEIKKPTYDSVSDIMNVAEHPIDTFLDNPDLFHQLKESKIYVDKELAKDIPLIQTTIDHFLKTLGLKEDQIFFIKSDKNEIQFQGNSAIIHISSDKIMEAYKSSLNDSRISKVVSKLAPETYNHFVTAKMIAHELGHFFFTKWLKFGEVSKDNFITLINDFNNWLAKNKIEPYSFAHISKMDIYQKYHSIFDEYFAERVAKNLIYGSLFNRFSKSKSQLATQITGLVNSFKSYLQKFGINLDKKYLHDDMIQDIINKNKESIKKTGETYWKGLETSTNDKVINDTLGDYPFANKTLSEIRNTEVIDPESNAPIDWQRKANPQAINIGTQALNKLGQSADLFNRKFFGKTTLAQILKRNPNVQLIHRIIRDAEYKASSIANNAWFGPVTFSQFKDRPIFQRFSKIKNPDSPYMVLHDLTNQEAYNLHKVYQQGYEQGLSHTDSLTQLGQSLTPKEQKAYKVFADMFDLLYHHVHSVENNLGKNDIIQYKKGYYPVIRRGDYFITISYDGNLIHREHFATKAAADARKDFFGRQGLGGFDISDVQSLTDQPRHPGTYEMIDIANSWLQRDVLEDHTASFEKLKKILSERGGKLGMHHEERFNVSGYKGSELGLTPEELGKRFKEGIQDYVKEVSSQLRNMDIKTKLDPLLENDIKVSDPEAYAAGKQMRDSAMNFIPNNVEALDKGVYELVDKIASKFSDDFHPSSPIYKTLQHTLLSTFYLLKVLPSLGMTVTQLLSPITAIRHAASDGGLRSISSFGKGLYKFFSGDAETIDALYHVSQSTDIIEPQFINTLHLMEGSKVSEFLKDWVLMRKPQEAADVLSRAITFSYLLNHYKDLGYSYEHAKDQALNGTTATMAGYSSGETAPVFKHLGGIIGESLRPLQTYGQTQLGNLIADIKYLKDKPTELKSWAPLVMYGITSTIMGGVLTGAVISQYETIRLLLMKLNPMYHLPSILDLLYKMPNMLEGVVEDPNAQTKLLGYGAISAGTGIDLGASSRVTETLPTNILTIMLAMAQGQDAAKEVEKALGRSFPVQSSLYGMTHGAVSLGVNALTGGGMHDFDKKTAIDELAPRGTLSYGLKELAGVNTTKVMGQRTENIATGKEQKMLMPRGPMEKLSGYLGNNSTEQRLVTDRGLQNQREEQIIKNKINDLYTMYNQNPKPEYIDRLIQLGAVDKDIKSALETRTVNALVPQDIRFITNKKGSIANTPTEARKVNRIFNFGDK